MFLLQKQNASDKPGDDNSGQNSPFFLRISLADLLADFEDILIFRRNFLGFVRDAMSDRVELRGKL